MNKKLKNDKKLAPYFQSYSDSERIGHRMLHSARGVLLLHSFVLVLSFAVGLFVLMQFGNSKAATTFRISPTGNDSNSCTTSQPCLTMNRAYQVASPGDTIEMSAGTYPKQTINYLASKSTAGDGLPNVVFKPVSGAQVSVGGVEIRSSNIEVRGIKSSINITTYSLSNKDPSTSSQYPRILQHPIPSDIVVRNIDALGTSFDIHTANNVLVQDVEVGGFTGTSDGFRISGVGKPYEPTNVVLDNVRLHDVRRTAGSTNHVDCMQISGAKGLVIKNSKFWHCATQGVFFKEASGQTIDNILLENNWFGPCSIPGADVNCTQNLIIDDGVSNVTVRFNSFGSNAGFRPAGGVGASNLYVYGNLGGSPTCVGAASPTYRYNVWKPGGNSCHSTDIVASSAYQLGFTSDPTSGGTFDFHIGEGSVARNRIPSSFSPPDGRGLPATDFDGGSRLAEGSFDIGSDEYGSVGGITPPPSIPSAPVVSISSSPSAAQQGNSSTISWTATNSPSSCIASGDWTGAKAASGSTSTGVLSTVKVYSYTLTCSNSGGSGSASATVNVTSSPSPAQAKPVVTLKVSPSTVNRGGSSTISWTATNSPSSCIASGDWTGAKAASGSTSTGQLEQVKSYTYTLTCTNSGGSTTASVALVVVPKKPIVTLKLSKEVINENESSSIAWTTSEQPDSCKASGDWNGDKNVNGGSENTGVISGSTSKTYIITCSNVGGSTSASVTLSVSTPQAPIDTSVQKPTVTLSASPETLESGQQATLTWATGNNPESCTASEAWAGEKNKQGGNENTENLAEGKTYVLTCTNAGGSTSASVFVSVVTIDGGSGEVRVNNQLVPDLKVDNPAIVGESSEGAELGTNLATSGVAQEKEFSSKVSGMFDTTVGKVTLAGIFAAIVTACSGSVFFLKHHTGFKLFHSSLFGGKGGDGEGPIGMIRG